MPVRCFHVWGLITASVNVSLLRFRALVSGHVGEVALKIWMQAWVHGFRGGDIGACSHVGYSLAEKGNQSN